MDETLDLMNSSIAQKLSASPSQFWLFYHLACSYRAGFLSLSFDNGKVVPDPRPFVGEKASPHDIVEAFRLLPEGVGKYFVKEKDKLYFRRGYDAQKNIFSQLVRLQEGPLSPHLCLEKMKKAITEAQEEGGISQEQQSLLLAACERKVNCFFGGPGSGKSYCASFFLKVFLDAFTGPFLKVALVGPTGKAADNLKRACEKRNIAHFQDFEVKTIHALLHTKGAKLHHNLIIVDEASMIGAELLSKFLALVQKGCHLLFLGDPWQLAPVNEPDFFFQWYTYEKEKDSFLELSRSHRTDRPEIGQLSTLMKAGSGEEIFKFLKASPTIRFHEVAYGDEEKTLTQHQERLFQEFYSRERDSFFPMTILTPFNYGVWGCDRVNNLFFELAEKCGKKRFPIIVTKNDWKLSLMNGTQGTMDRQYGYFAPSKLQEPIPLSLISEYEMAYCLSIHKSQGSEYDKVVILLPPGSALFGRRLFYTALTRAKTEIEIWASRDTILNIM